MICPPAHGDVPARYTEEDPEWARSALAAQAGAKRLWLTHYSPMITDPEAELHQAQAAFPAAECGFDGKRITLQYEEEPV